MKNKLKVFLLHLTMRKLLNDCFCMTLTAYMYLVHVVRSISFDLVHEKTNNLGFRPGPTETQLYSHSIKLEA